MDAWNGWPTDGRIEDLRNQWLDATDATERKRLTAAIQVEALDNAQLIPLGQYFQSAAWRRGLTGFLKGPCAGILERAEGVRRATSPSIAVPSGTTRSSPGWHELATTTARFGQMPKQPARTSRTCPRRPADLRFRLQRALQRFAAVAAETAVELPGAFPAHDHQLRNGRGQSLDGARGVHDTGNAAEVGSTRSQARDLAPLQ